MSLDLDAAKARLERYRAADVAGGSKAWEAVKLARLVPDLIDEVDRLRAQLAARTTAALDVPALRELIAAATGGPWTAADDGLVWAPDITDPVSGSVEVDDARFIAAARQALPAALDEIERLTALLNGPGLWPTTTPDGETP